MNTAAAESQRPTAYAKIPGAYISETDLASRIETSLALFHSYDLENTNPSSKALHRIASQFGIVATGTPNISAPLRMARNELSYMFGQSNKLTPTQKAIFESFTDVLKGTPYAIA